MTHTYYRILETTHYETFNEPPYQWRFHWCEPKSEEQALQDFDNLVKSEKGNGKYRLVKIEVLNES